MGNESTDGSFDATDVAEAVKRETQDGPGEIPEGDGDFKEDE